MKISKIIYSLEVRMEVPIGGILAGRENDDGCQ
jgi:hypothetical protein